MGNVDTRLGKLRAQGARHKLSVKECAREEPSWSGERVLPVLALPIRSPDNEEQIHEEDTFTIPKWRKRQAVSADKE